jgi:hypothetical protein
VHDDQPTLPNLPPYDSGGFPTWPGLAERAHPAPGAEQRTLGSVSPVLLGVSLGANVVLLLAVLGLLLLGRAGFFSPSVSAPAAGTPGVSTSRSALSTPSATLSPLPQTGWLQVAPGSITVGCDGDQRHQLVVLTNTGSQPVQWQADLSLPQDQASVTVSPNQGQLNAGASTTVQIQNQAHTDGAQGSAGQQGTIRFSPQSTEAGPAPSVSYTSVGCQ